MLRILGAFLSLILLYALFAALAPYEFVWPPEVFLSNLRVIASQTLVIVLGAIGMTVVIVSAGIDLSVGSVVALSMVISALTFNRTESSTLAALAGICTGTVCGLFNGAIITGFKLVPFVATLGMMGLARGLAKLVAGNTMVNVGGLEWEHSVLRLLTVLFTPALLVVLTLSILMALVLRSTVFGRHVFAIGSNEATALLCGIRLRAMKVSLYTLAGAFSGLAGVMFFSRQAQGDPTAAPGLELDVIAAVVIGGGSLKGGEGSILGSIIGALLMGVLRHGLVKIEVSNPVQEILIGLIIIVAVVVDQLRQRRVE